ncbi:MAG: YcxB family protein [Ruminococcaceae bacterium]|nr:YcxB family protein [Oscillospiraceae bacterium]
MAFCDLKPVRVFDEASGCTFIIGDMFAVYPFGTDRPTVYNWNMMREVTESKKALVFKTEDSKYTIMKSCFLAREDYFRAIAIIESSRREAEFPYVHERRVLPLKHKYIDCATIADAYTGQVIIDEGDAAAAFITMMNVKLVKLLWLIALLIMLLTFGILHFFVGITRNNILYFIPISVAVGGIITLLVYLACHAVARNKYQKLAGCDPASEELITFVVCQFGFAACESCVYDSQELMPWRELDYFIETDKMFIFYKDNNAIVYMPKKAFEKKYIGGILDTIALHLEQK